MTYSDDIYPFVVYINLCRRRMETMATDVAQAEEDIYLEDEEKQRVFYASVRETIVSRERGLNRMSGI